MPRIAAVRSVDMSSSNAWAEFAGVFWRTRPAFLEHESAKAELKRLMPEDAKEAIGHGIRAKRAKSGAVSFDLLSVEAAGAARPPSSHLCITPRAGRRHTCQASEHIGCDTQAHTHKKHESKRQIGKRKLRETARLQRAKDKIGRKDEGNVFKRKQPEYPPELRSEHVANPRQGE
jgi:hypothetical protein